MNNLNLVPVYPEIFLTIATSAILLIDMFLSDAKRYITYALSLVTLCICAALTVIDFNTGATTYTFHNMFVSDPMSNLLKLFSYLAVGLTLIYSRQYVTARGMLSGNLGGEFYALALFSLLGQMVMISGNNFLIIYLGLELMSLSLYALVALRREHAVSTEAAMKYFILGAMASGFLLYGISMLYGATGSLDLTEVAKATTSGTVNKTVLVFGIVFLVAGLAFKLGVVPFHMWGAGCLSGCADCRDVVAGRCAEAGCIRYFHSFADRRIMVFCRRLATDADRACSTVDGSRQHHRNCTNQFEANAGLFDDFANGLHVARSVIRRFQRQ
jgi:NADH-quinone oxidoreductase subunit N